MLRIPEVLQQVAKRSIGHVPIERIRPAAQRRREAPQDAGVQDEALSGARVRPAVRPDPAEEAASVAVDRPGLPERQYPFAQLVLGGESEGGQSVDHHDAILTGVEDPRDRGRQGVFTPVGREGTSIDGSSGAEDGIGGRPA